MNITKYLLMPAIAFSAFACSSKPKSVNKQLPNTAVIVKTGSSKSIDSAATAIRTDTLTDKQVTSQRLISPGNNIGETSINERMATVFNRLGKPDSSDAAMGSALAIWYADHKRDGYKTIIFSGHKYNNKKDVFQYVKRILVTSPYFRTTEGLGVGSTFEQIRNQYKLKVGNGYTDKGIQMSVYDDISKGISFEIDPTTGTCAGVIIQKPGDAASSYLNMN